MAKPFGVREGRRGPRPANDRSRARYYDWLTRSFDPDSSPDYPVRPGDIDDLPEDFDPADAPAHGRYRFSGGFEPIVERGAMDYLYEDIFGPGGEDDDEDEDEDQVGVGGTGSEDQVGAGGTGGTTTDEGISPDEDAEPTPGEQYPSGPVVGEDPGEDPEEDPDAPSAGMDSGAGADAAENMDGSETGGGSSGTDDDDDSTDPTNWLDDWMDIASTYRDVGQIFDYMSQIPGYENFMSEYGGMLGQLEELIATRGEAGLRAYEEEYAEASGRVERQARASMTQAMANMASRGLLDSSIAVGAQVDVVNQLNFELSQLAGNLMEKRSDKAYRIWEQALAQKQSLIVEGARTGMDFYGLAQQVRQFEAQENRAWAEMGLKERLTAMGYDVELEKANIQKTLEEQRMSLERELGFADIDARKYLAEAGWDIELAIERMREEHQEKLQGKDIELERWKQTLLNEIAWRRTDIDMMNVMGSLQQGEWELQIREADLQLRRELGEAEYSLRQDELGQDWDKFLASIALQEWTSRGQWANNESVARLYAESGGGSWIGDLLGGLGGLAAGAGAIVTAASDSALKQDVRPLDITKLKFKSWNWANNALKLGLQGKDFGLIAQDVEKCAPEAVFVDADGYKKINYGTLFAMLIAYLKHRAVI